MGKRREFVNDEIYHVILRGVEQRKIFLDDDDYYRGIFSLFEFNTTNLVTIRNRRKERERFKRLLQSRKGRLPDNPLLLKKNELVEVLAFCLMPNHIHLLLRQKTTGGISKFIQKCAAGYATYFNQKHKRTGHLFQGKFHSVHIKDDKQLLTVFIYIHTNPLAIIFPSWKEKGIKNLRRAIKFIEGYKWSSYRDYLGKKNFPSVSVREFLTEVIGGKANCRKAVNNWLRSKCGQER